MTDQSNQVASEKPRENPSENPFDTLIQYIEDIATVKFPDHLKRLLKYCGFDNLISLSELSDNDVDNMNKFASQELPQLLKESELENFYGIFSKKPELFRISDGHKKLLFKLTEEARDRLISRKRTRNIQSSENEEVQEEVNVRVTDKSKKNRKSYNKTRTTTASKQSPRNQSQETVHEDLSNDASNSRSRSKSNSIPKSQKRSSDDIIKHIKEVALKYLKKFCQEELPQDQSERTIEDAKNIVVTMDGTSAAKVMCFLCKFQSRIYAQKTRYGITWVLSNFNKHVKTHFKSNSKMKKQDNKVKNSTILSYYSISSGASNNENNSTNSTTLDNNYLSNAAEEASGSQESSGTISQCSETSNRNIIWECNQIDIDNMDFSPSRIVQGTDNSAVNVVELSPKIIKRTRHERVHNKLITVAYNRGQTKLSDFYSVIQNIETQIKEDLNTSTIFTSSFRNNLNLTGPSEEQEVSVDYFLDVLKNHALENSNKSKNRNRFCEPLKLFSLYIFIIGGRLLYETLKSNMPNALPSISTLHRSIDNTTNFLEGIVQMEKLKEYLMKRKYPLRVFISEDQTSVIRRIQYDSKSNKMIGFVLPLSRTSGFPLTDRFIVNSVKDIERAFGEETMSTTAYTFMVQPLIQNAPAFCLALFGSDNKFTSQDVLNRWAHLKEQATLQGIQVDGFASDGDTRCLKAMMTSTKLPVISQQPNCPYSPYFQMEYNIEKPTCIQDPIHIGTKMKTRLLNSNISLKIGEGFVSVSHLEILIKNYPKDQHFLCSSFLNSTDKMNFEAIDRLSSSAVITLLESIPDSQATKQFLILTRHILDTFLEKSLKIEDRLYKIWYSTFFIRLWRSWLLANKYSITKNCITSNTYSCIELNAHAILLLIEKCRNEPQCFIPWFYGSQQCEKIFRQTRSMTTTFSTVVNFSIMDILRRLNRIQMLNEISTELGDKFHFPREEVKRLGTKSTFTFENLPSQSKIANILKEASANAKDDARKLGIRFQSESEAQDACCCFQMQVPKFNLDSEEQQDIIESDLESDTNHELDNATDHAVVADNDSDFNENYMEEINQDVPKMEKFQGVNIKDYSGKKTSCNSQFLHVVLGNNKQAVIRKSSICWFFSENSGRLSSDRLYRVRGMKIKRQHGKACPKKNRLTSRRVSRRATRLTKT